VFIIDKENANALYGMTPEQIVPDNEYGRCRKSGLILYDENASKSIGLIFAWIEKRAIHIQDICPNKS